MKKLIASFVLALSCILGVAAVPACTSAQLAPLVAPSEKLGMCILQAAVGDLVEAISDPASLIPAIIGSCTGYGVATVEQVVAIIEEALGASPVSDSGAVLIARLKKVHAAALVVASKKSDAGAAGQ